MKEELLQTEEITTPAHLRPKEWLKFLLFWFLGLLAIGAIGCFILYRYLGVYETVRPERILDELMETTSAEEWKDLALQGFTEGLSVYDDAETLRESYRSAFLSGSDFTYMKDSLSSTDTEKYYRVRLGNVDICTVTLKAAEKSAGFGLKNWAVEAVTPADGTKNLTSVAVEVTAPAGEKIQINGKTLDESCIADAFVAYEDLTAVEQQLEDVPHGVRYVVEAMYGSVLVTDASGSELLPVSSENGIVSYTKEAEPRTTSVKAPFDAVVYCNGVALTESDISSQEESLLTSLQDYTGGVDWYNVTYELGPLYGEPVFRAETSEGTVLSPETDEDGQMQFFLPEDEALREAHLETVQAFFDAYIEYSSQNYEDYLFCKVLWKILPDSALEQYLRNSVVAMSWAPSEADITYNYLDFCNFHAVSDNCFLCTIRYNANYSAEFFYQHYEKVLENTYEMAFVKYGKNWYAAAMRIADE